MDVNAISQKLKSGEYKLRCKSEGKSDVWDKFGIVSDEKSDLDYAACKSCHQVFVYRGRQTGTAALKRHKCRVAQGQTMLNIGLKPVVKNSGVSKSTKDTVTSAAVDFVCRDLRPFDTVDGQGFLDLAQEVRFHCLVMYL